MEETPIPDLATLVANLRNQRFDGYGPVRIADEIDKFRSGEGIGSISAAVESLDTVASSLAETESTLRVELGKLGIAWRGESALAAAAAVEEDAEFAATFKDRLESASHALFAQGEAFNRTRDKLPDAELVRKAIGGTNLGDALMSLIGIETDHAEQVAKAREATKHAAQVLNEYASDSGNYLETAEPAPRPRTLGFTVAVNTPAAVEAGGRPDSAEPPAVSLRASVPPPAAADDSSTAAACAPGETVPGEAAPEPSPTASGVGQPWAPAAASSAGSPESYATAPAPAGGQNGSGQAAREWYEPDGSTSISGVAPPVPTVPAAPSGYSGAFSSTGSYGSVPPASGSAYSGGGYSGSSYSGNYANRYSGGYSNGYANNTTPAPGRSTGAAPLSGLRGAGRLPTGFGVASPGGQSPAGSTAKPLIPVRPGGTNDTSDESLARGRRSGLAPLSREDGDYLGSTFVARPSGGPSAGHIGAGITAFGAGAAGAAGAMGDQERQGRGVGRSAPHAGTSPRQMTFQSNPDEEEAEATHRAESGTRGAGRDGMLERAAPRDNEEPEHVRSHGVDDTDLFSDDRMVAPASIASDPADGSEA